MFDEIDLNVEPRYALAAIYFIGSREIGRRRLARQIGLTKSKTRTMLEHLRDAGFVESGKTMELTTEGENLFAEIAERIECVEEVEVETISAGGQDVAALLKQVGVESSVSLRDEAVRGGALGMTVLIYDNGFEFPEDETPGSDEILSELEQLEEKFDPEPGDPLLVSSGEDIRSAKKGLWSAIYSLINLDHIDS